MIFGSYNVFLVFATNIPQRLMTGFVVKRHIQKYIKTNATLDHKTSLKSLGYIYSNSQKYTVWVKINDFSFMPKIISILSKDHVP